MKKKLAIISAVLFFSILPSIFFVGCDKDTNCYLEVEVLNEANRAPIPGAKVVVNQDGGTVYAEGITDGNGKFNTTFNAPAILNITATLAVQFGERRGQTSIRLKEGETVNAVVTMPEDLF